MTGAEPPGRGRPGTPRRVLKHTFGAVADPRARVLILGSMPGAASLAAGEYYAHPQNQFWPIMGGLFGAGRGRPYARRLEILRAAGVALWDVCAECVRPGSMDHAIDRSTVKPNDLAALFRRCPEIRAVFFNGQAAARLFRRVVPPRPGGQAPALRLVTLPSTSPAHASASPRDKARAWRAVKDALDSRRLPR